MIGDGLICLVLIALIVAGIVQTMFLPSLWIWILMFSMMFIGVALPILIIRWWSEKSKAKARAQG